MKLQNKEFNIASLLKISRPKKNNNEVKYTVISDINKKELEYELPKLTEYIRKSLKNDFWPFFKGSAAAAVALKLKRASMKRDASPGRTPLTRLD